MAMVWVIDRSQTSTKTSNRIFKKLYHFHYVWVCMTIFTEVGTWKQMISALQTSWQDCVLYVSRRGGGVGGGVPGLHPGGGNWQRPRLPHQAPRLLAGLPLPLGLATLRQGQRNSNNQCCGSGTRCFFLPQYPGLVINQDSDLGSGIGMNNPDHISESLETNFSVNILKFFDADPGKNSERR